MPEEIKDKDSSTLPSQGNEDSDRSSEMASVKLWCKRIKDAKCHWEEDFKRMKDNMAFAAGIQWEGQTTLDYKKYIANITLRNVNEKVASLYARNPKAVFNKRKRLDFQLWDGKVETLAQASQAVTMQMQSGMPISMPAAALLQDYQQGMAHNRQVEKIGTTLEILYQWMVDEQEPDFKEAMKSMVASAIVTGVGYVKLGFERDFTSSIDTYNTSSKMQDRVKRMQSIIGKMSDGDVQPDSSRVEELKMLVASMEQSFSDGEMKDVSERLVFSFPSPTSIIVDPKATSLRNFSGARWVCEETIAPLEEINEFFETDIKPNAEFAKYTADGQPDSVKDTDVKDEQRSPMCCLWEVCDLRTKSRFYVVDGWKFFVQKSDALEPSTRRFWPWFALTFNNIVTTSGSQKVTIFPPSDVQNMKSAQKEWNRTRNSLRSHRAANAPKYITGAQWLTDDDKEKITEADENVVIELQGAQSGADVEKLIRPFPVAQINPEMYDTGPLQQDVLLVNGEQQANLGPTTNSTATEATIAEQSKNTTSSSNRDDLDCLLTAVARAGGEMLMREMSPQNVTRIVGPGAVWPDMNREDFLNEIELEAEAASSGRPNQAMEQQKFQMIVPLLLQAGANPQAIIREGVKRLDDSLDVAGFFPVPMPSPPEQQGQLSKNQKNPAKKSSPPGNEPGPRRIGGQPPSPTGPGVPMARHPQFQQG